MATVVKEVSTSHHQEKENFLRKNFRISDYVRTPHLVSDFDIDFREVSQRLDFLGVSIPEKQLIEAREDLKKKAQRVMPELKNFLALPVPSVFSFSPPLSAVEKIIKSQEVFCDFYQKQEPGRFLKYVKLSEQDVEVRRAPEKDMNLLYPDFLAGVSTSAARKFMEKAPPEVNFPGYLLWVMIIIYYPIFQNNLNFNFPE